MASLALKGWTQAAIARQLQIPQGTVSRDLAAMREFWREFPVYDFDRIRLEQLQKIDLVEAEAWAAWQRSQGRRHTMILRVLCGLSIAERATDRTRMKHG